MNIVNIEEIAEPVFVKVSIKNQDYTDELMKFLEITDFYIVNNNLFYSI